MKYKYKIVVDSSANLTEDYIKDPSIGFAVVPLTIRIDGKDYIDDANGDKEGMLKALDNTKERPSTSCPSPLKFAEAFQDAEFVICITISSKMSGSFNSAFLGSAQAEQTRVHVVDSQAVSGTMDLLVDKAYELMKQNIGFEEIEEKIDEYQKSLRMLFVLNDFGNLVRAGRMNKIIAFVAMSLSIKPICQAEDGEIKIYTKQRTMRRAIESLGNSIKDFVSDFSNRVCIITYVDDLENAQKVKDVLAGLYPFKEIRLVPARLLCSFYALRGSLLVCF
jgi:DegV family protein with EDD domain